jgi:hypothetical protein
MIRTPSQLKNKPDFFSFFATKRFKFFVLTLIFFLFGYMFISCSKTKTENTDESVGSAPGPSQTPLVKIDPNADFSEFKHLNPDHQRLPCELCHVREDNSPKPKLIGHLPCAGCHIQQFEDKKNKICSICHTDAENGDLKEFPSLKGFNAVFDHANHIRQTNCVTCHKPKRDGISFTIPTRANSHQTCFQCHQPEKAVAGKNIGSCQTCHQPGSPPRAVLAKSKTIALRLSHGNHKFNCTSCHTVRKNAPRGNQVSAPVLSMHFPKKNANSCATCHNNKRAFGGDDFSDCKRCHKGNTFTFP